MEFLNRTLFTLQAGAVTPLRLLWATFGFALVMVIAHFGSVFLRRRLFGRGHGNPPTEKSLLRVCRAGAVFVGLVVALRIVGFDLAGPLLFLGLVALVVAVVARGVLANYASGLVLLYERPVSVGDHIRLGAETGEVEAIRLRVTHVRTPGNTRLIVPNRVLMREAITNFSAPDGRVRLCIGVQVAHGSDANDVIMTLRKVAERNPRVRKNPAPRSLMTGVVPAGLQFELWAWIGDPADAPWVENELYRGIDSEFQKLRIRLSSPPAPAFPSSGLRSVADDSTRAPRAQESSAPPRAQARPAAVDETAKPGPPRPSHRRPTENENGRTRQARPLRHEPPADPTPSAVTLEVRAAKPESDPQAAPKRNRSRTRKRGEQDAPPGPAQSQTEPEEEGRPSAAVGEFTLLEQPELSFDSAAKEDAPALVQQRAPEQKTAPDPEARPAQPSAPHDRVESPVQPPKESVTETPKPEPARRPTFGRSKRKATRR